MDETDDELEAIRQQKREQLEARLRGEAEPEEATADAPSEPIHVDGASHLQEITGTHDVVLADFYADWCGPCKMLEPIVADIASETDAAVAKVDVDAHQQLAAQYQVQGVPTMVLFSDGEVAERIVGVRDKAELTSMIQRYGN
jgi:thioredoxin 1